MAQGASRERRHSGEGGHNWSQRTTIAAEKHTLGWTPLQRDSAAVRCSRWFPGPPPQGERTPPGHRRARVSPSGQTCWCVRACVRERVRQNLHVSFAGSFAARFTANQLRNDFGRGERVSWDADADMHASIGQPVSAVGAT